MAALPNPLRFFIIGNPIIRKKWPPGDEFAGPAARFFFKLVKKNPCAKIKITWPERREPRHLKKNVASAKSWRSYNGRIL